MNAVVAPSKAQKPEALGSPVFYSTGTPLAAVTSEPPLGGAARKRREKVFEMLRSTNRIAIAAAGAILFAAAPAQAETIPSAVLDGAYEVRTAKVPFADLNLSSAAGRERLDARIRAAVGEVCPATASRPHLETSQAHDCRQAAHADATKQTRKILAAKR